MIDCGALHANWRVNVVQAYRPIPGRHAVYTYIIQALQAVQIIADTEIGLPWVIYTPCTLLKYTIGARQARLLYGCIAKHIAIIGNKLVNCNSTS